MQRHPWLFAQLPEPICNPPFLQKGTSPQLPHMPPADLLLKNKDKYKNHPNPIALSVLKMKGLHIDFIRKNKNLTALTDQEEKNMNMDEKIEISLECKKVLEVIKTMGEKCQEILMLAADGMSMQEMQEITNVNSLGTVLSRLSNCRKELKELMA